MHNMPPRDLPAGAPADEVKAEFGRRLHATMVQAGFNQTQLAQRASMHLTDGARLGRDSISKYLSGHQVPNAERLKAIAKALNVQPTDLLPVAALRNDPASSPVSMRELDNGHVWLRINQEVAWDVAMKVLGLLKAERQDSPSSSSQQE